MIPVLWNASQLFKNIWHEKNTPPNLQDHSPSSIRVIFNKKHCDKPLLRRTIDFRKKETVANVKIISLKTTLHYVFAPDTRNAWLMPLLWLDIRFDTKYTIFISFFILCGFLSAADLDTNKFDAGSWYGGWKKSIEGNVNDFKIYVPWLKCERTDDVWVNGWKIKIIQYWTLQTEK